MIEGAVDKTGQKKSNENKSTEMWNRVGHVEITIFQGKGSKTFNFDGLDFKFSVSTILGRIPEGNMTVSICGLSQDTANQIITLCNVMQALNQRKTLKLYAGYADPENKDYKGELLAVMDIVNATITTPPPDVWLQITAVYAAWLNDRVFAIDIMDFSKEKEVKQYEQVMMATSITGYTQEAEYKEGRKTARYVKIDDALKQICDGLNMISEKYDRNTRYTYDTSRVSAKRKRRSYVKGKTKRFEFSGTLSQIPTKVAEYYKVLAIWEYRDDNTICLAVYPDPKHYPYLSQQEKTYVDGSTIKFLDVDHGLIGIPKLKDSIKLECRCFLDGQIKAGDYVSVKSEMIPVIYDMGQNIKPANKTLANQWGSYKWRVDKDTKKVIDEDKDTIKAYQIMKIKYTGHLRGNQWFCDIEARRPELIQDRIEEVKPATLWLTEDQAKLQKGWTYDEETGEMRKRKE